MLYLPIQPFAVANKKINVSQIRQPTLSNWKNIESFANHNIQS